MKLSTQIKSISYLKAHAAAIARNMDKTEAPLIITQNGEAKIVVQGIEQYEKTQETLAPLRILALGNRQIEESRTVPAAEAVRCIRKRQADA